MTRLRTLKLAGLGLLRGAGAFALVRNSSWRRRRLLILCFHGVALEDEHEWAPRLYIPPSQFERRLEQLRRGRYSVVRLGDGLNRLHTGTLPERSVAITFDDGTHDFHRRALPLLREFQFPATVYLTTYYCLFNRPVFRLICAYMLWRSRGLGQLSIPIAGMGGPFDLGREPERRRALVRLDQIAKNRGLSGLEKDVLAQDLARSLAVDYQALCERRILHVMTPEEVREAAAAGIDIQLHTHRHRTPQDRESFQRELRENGEVITRLAGMAPRHFCYPSGVHRPVFQPWLEESGVRSAVTCAPGLATARTPRLSLPRLLDHAGLSDLEFGSWLDGVGALLPRRDHDFADPEEEVGQD